MIIFLNGTSSSGKTSVAKELQELLGGFPLNFSIDNILYSLPPSALGKMISGQKIPGLEYGKLEEGFYRCARTLSETGHDLIVDNAVVSKKSADLLLKYLKDQAIFMVGISCDLDELRKREKQRGDRTLGEAESQNPMIHRFCTYDLNLDSTSKTPKELAGEVLTFLKAKKSCSAIQTMEADLYRNP